MTQRKIIDIAREHDIIVHADEIFRPLYHDKVDLPPSLVEHDYSKVIVTSSMSKVWGMSGVRVGWMVCRDRQIIDTVLNGSQYTSQSTSFIDEIVATEALSSRCRPVLLKRHLEYAQKDLEMLDAFVKKNSDVCSWTRPTAGSTAFVKFSDSNGKPWDDVDLGYRLLESQGLLVAPGSLSFRDEDIGQVDFQGYVRINFTKAPDDMRKGLDLLDEFLAQRRKAA